VLEDVEGYWGMGIKDKMGLWVLEAGLGECRGILNGFFFDEKWRGNKRG